MEVARGNPSDGVVQTDAGLIVPGHAVRAMVDRERDRKRRPTAYDPDGRRRIGFTKADAKLVQRTVDLLNRHGIGLVLACSDRFDGKPHCEGFLTPEGRRGRDQDAGFGCQCTRVHFLGV